MENFELLPFYCPIFMDFAGPIGSYRRFSCKEMENQFSETHHEIIEKTEIPDHIPVDELIDKSIAAGLSALQITVLLLKRNFEGHVFMKYGLTPVQLFNEFRTSLSLDQLFYHSFLQDFYEYAEYREGIKSGYGLLKKRLQLPEVPIDAVIDISLANHFLLFPISYLENYNLPDLKIPDRGGDFLKLTILEGYVLNILHVVNSCNKHYEKLFREDLAKAQLACDTLSDMKIKLSLAMDPNLGFKTLDELNNYMYQLLIKSKDNYHTRAHDNEIHMHDELTGQEERYRYKIKYLFRQSVKNLSELRNPDLNKDSEGKLFELNNEVTMVNSLKVYNFHTGLITYAEFILVLSRILNFRKLKGWCLFSDEITDTAKLMPISLNTAEEYADLKKKIMEKFFDIILNSGISNKLNIICEEPNKEFHQLFLRKKVMEIEEEIRKIMEEIPSALKKNQREKNENK